MIFLPDLSTNFSQITRRLEYTLKELFVLHLKNLDLEAIRIFRVKQNCFLEEFLGYYLAVNLTRIIYEYFFSEWFKNLVAKKV